jgi:hypothetical protein
MLPQFAAAKGFDIEFLSQHGVAEEGNVLKFRYLTSTGQRASRQRLRLSLNGDKKFAWTKGEGRPVPYGLWRLAEGRRRSGDLYLVEGESDSLTLWLHGREALGIPGADNCSLLQAPHVAGFRRIFIVRENDHGGEVFEKGCAGRLAGLEYRGEVRVVEMQRANAKDPNDLHVRFLSKPSAFDSEFDALVEMGRPVELEIVGLEAFDASTIQEKKVEWLWPHRVPLGKLVLSVGAPGLGKSFEALDVATRLSVGGFWPDGARVPVIGRSIVFSAEDGMEDTIVSRLIAQGADRSKIIISKRVREMNDSGEMVRRGFNLTRDLPLLERLLNANPDTQLVIIDPVSAYTGRTDTHKNSDTRTEILDPLAELAERRGLTVLCITHWNKGSGTSLERVSGSIAFPAAARQVWGFAADPEDATRTLMLFGKSNVGPRVPGLAFRIVEVDGRATLQWEAGIIERKLDEVLRQERGAETKSGDKAEQACELIQEMCGSGEVLSAELEKRAAAMGISKTTLWDARRTLRCRARRAGFGKGGGWWVSLPQTQPSGDGSGRDDGL